MVPRRSIEYVVDEVLSRVDGISIFSFACVNDVEDCLTHADHAAIEVSENALSDAVGPEWWTAVNYSVINRLLPELATDREVWASGAPRP